MMFGMGLLVMFVMFGLPLVLVLLLAGGLIGLAQQKNHPSDPGQTSRPVVTKTVTQPGQVITLKAGTCAHCGANMQPGWTYCPQCGAPAGH